MWLFGGYEKSTDRFILPIWVRLNILLLCKNNAITYMDKLAKKHKRSRAAWAKFDCGYPWSKLKVFRYCIKRYFWLKKLDLYFWCMDKRAESHHIT